MSKYGVFSKRIRYTGKRLTIDGERREIRPSLRRSRVKVTAVREDKDTPYIELVFDGREPILLDDGSASDLIEMIGKALAVLPTSK